MGSFNSHNSSFEGLSSATGKVRKSNRLMERLRSRQSSRSDLIVHQQTSNAIDPIRRADDAHDEGGESMQNGDMETADAGKL